MITPFGIKLDVIYIRKGRRKYPVAVEGIVMKLGVAHCLLNNGAVIKAKDFLRNFYEYKEPKPKEEITTEQDWNEGQQQILLKNKSSLGYLAGKRKL